MNARRYKAHPQSAAGDFYVVNNECISCGAPHAIAPDLIGWAETADGFSHCIWKRQPQTPAEVEDAIDVILASEVACHRYAGDDQQVINRLGPEYCDASLRSQPKAALVDPKQPAHSTFALMTAGRPPLARMIAALRSMASRLSQKD